MKKWLIFLCVIFSVGAFSKVAQQDSLLKISTIEVKQAIENQGLKFKIYENKFPERREYIINSDAVIYQDFNTQRKFSPDMKTFSVLDSPFHHYGEALARDKNGVYYRGKFLNINPEGLEIIKIFWGKSDYDNEFLWRNKDFIFLKDQKLKIEDPASFHQIPKEESGRIFSDKNNFYFIDFKDNIKFFKKIKSEKFFPVFENGKPIFYKGELVEPINLYLMKTSKYVLEWKYDKNHKRFLSEVKNIDNQTIKKLSNHYAMDKNHAYFQTEIVPIPTKRLHLVKVFDQKNSRYITDGEILYQNKNFIRKGLDNKTFQMIPDTDYYYDKNGIYQRKYDPSSREIFNEAFPFVKKEPFSAENISFVKGYIIYGNQAIYNGFPHEYFDNLTAEQVDLLKKGEIRLAKIGEKVVLREEFEYNLDKIEGKIYWKKLLTPADAQTFEPVGKTFFKDKNHIYLHFTNHIFKIIKGIDPQRFKSLSNGFYDDGEYLYCGVGYDVFRLIKSKNAQLLAMYKGYRTDGGEESRTASYFYLFKNVEGYYLLGISNGMQYRFLGKKLPREKKFLQKIRNQEPLLDV